VQVLYPTLAGVVAPFERDVAERRDALMSAPALTEEYNELALLLWTAARYGTRAVAQVELRHARAPSHTEPAQHNQSRPRAIRTSCRMNTPGCFVKARGNLYQRPALTRFRKPSPNWGCSLPAQSPPLAWVHVCCLVVFFTVL
jgi:hypothetical protein